MITVRNSGQKIKNEAKEQVNSVIKQLNTNGNNSARRTSPIRSNNSSVLGKSNKPVVIK
jgi:hypothetical protein